MITFNGDAGAKRTVVQFAAGLAAQVDGTSRHSGRERVRWSKRDWCPGNHICQKGEKCDHRFYADEIGVPVAVAYAERAIFLCLPADSARKWSANFLGSIPVGVDLDLAGVWKKMALYMLADKRYGLLSYARTREQHDAISAVIKLYETDNSDAAASEEAADDCILAGRSPYDNQTMSAKEALEYSASMACNAAHYLARAAADQRFANEAVMASEDCVRHLAYSQWMSGQHNPEDDVPRDSRGYVNAAAYLIAAGDWRAIRDQGERIGYSERERHHQRLADKLLSLLRESAGGNALTRLLRNVRHRVAA